jgi:hypothetical protein
MKRPAHLGRGGGAGGFKQQTLNETAAFSPNTSSPSIVSRDEVGRIEFFIVPSDGPDHRDQRGGQTLAVRVERVDLRAQHCTCFAQGTCPVCRQWTDALQAYEARKSWRTPC